MTTLLNMLLVNAVVVVPLAGVVWGVSRWARNPALTHVLWVLVLLKLVTPPCFRLPYSISIPSANQVTIVGEAALSAEPVATTSDTTSVTCSEQFVNSAVSNGDDPDQPSSGAPEADDCKSPAVISAPKPTFAFLFGDESSNADAEPIRSAGRATRAELEKRAQLLREKLRPEDALTGHPYFSRSWCAAATSFLSFV